jgi:hypothetical protein
MEHAIVGVRADKFGLGSVNVIRFLRHMQGEVVDPLRRTV